MEKVVRNILLFTTVSLFQIYSDFQVSQMMSSLTPPSSHKPSVLYCRSFQKHPIFTTFLLVLTLVTCVILQLNTNPSKLENMGFLHYTSLLHLIKNILLSIVTTFSKQLLFTTFSLFWLVIEVLLVSEVLLLLSKEIAS